MAKIICGVTNCYLNKDRCCCAHNIDVSGENAKSRGGTSCQTFGLKTDSFTNSVSEIPEFSEIECSATNCVHNEKNKCISKAIQIYGKSVTNDRETFCSTFRYR